MGAVVVQILTVITLCVLQLGRQAEFPQTLEDWTNRFLLNILSETVSGHIFLPNRDNMFSRILQQNPQNGQKTHKVIVN